jgi:hypothetical protein
MTSWFFPSNYDISSQKLISDFNYEDYLDPYGHVEKGELQNYANKFKANNFSESNYFTSVFVTSLNTLSADTLKFLEGLQENVQETLNYLQYITVNISYDVSENITLIEESTYADRISSNSINAQNVSTNTVQTQSVITNTMAGNIITCDTVTCNNLRARNLFVVGAYLFLQNGRTVPLMKSGTMIATIPSSIGSTAFNIEITILPLYKIAFLDHYGKLLFVLENSSSDDIIYSYILKLPTVPYKYNLYYHNKIIL